MPKKKIVHKAPEPEEEQKQPALTGIERWKEIGYGLVWLLPGIALMIYGVYGFATNNLYLLIPGRGGGWNFLHGPIAWIHFLFYVFLSVLLVTLSMDYLSEQEDHPKRDKIYNASWKLAIIFYVLTFIMINVWGLSGDLSSVRRIRVFGVWYTPYGPALWNLYFFYVCLAVVIISFIELWSEKYGAIAGKIAKVALVLASVSVVVGMVLFVLGIGGGGQ